MSAVHCRSCRHSKRDLSTLRVLDRKVGTLHAISESGLGGWENRRAATSFQGCIAALCPTPPNHVPSQMLLRCPPLDARPLGQENDIFICTHQ